jgi:hypothetical protein
MIANAILFLIGGWLGTFSAIYSVFNVPDIVANPSVVSGIAAATGYLNVAYSFLPLTVSAIVISFGVLVGFEAALIAYRVVKWGYSKIPGIT